MSAIEMNTDLRKLIDARLDVIDRVLVRAEVPWSDRRSIVGEIETQIFELLARLDRAPTERDVLEILQSLDPPESYLSDSFRGSLAGNPSAPTWLQLDRLKQALSHVSRFGQTATCVTGLVIVNGFVLMIIALSDGAIQWVVTLAGLAWLNHAAVQRFRVWSAEHRGHLLDEARRSLATWLMSKDSAPAA